MIQPSRKEKFDVYVVCKITGELITFTKDITLRAATDLVERLERMCDIAVLRYSKALPSDTGLFYVSARAALYRATRPLVERAARMANGHTSAREVLLGIQG